MKPTLKSHTSQWLLAAGQLLATFPLFLMSWKALGANLDEAANTQPVEVVSVWFVALFLVLFFGMIVGFFVYLWWNDKNRKQGGSR